MSARSVYNYSEGRPRSGSWMLVTSFLILIATALVLALKWDSLPESWTIHWGFRGQPNGWATKTFWGVFFPVIGGALICAFLEALAMIIQVKGTSRGRLSGETAAAVANLTAEMVRILELAVSVMFAVFALSLPLAQPVKPVGLVSLVVGVIIVALVFGIVRMSRGVRELKQAGHSGLEGYNGITYRNERDPRLWVPKISGLGYTLNFAHPWGWPMMIGFLTIPAIIVLIAVLLS